MYEIKSVPFNIPLSTGQKITQDYCHYLSIYYLSISLSSLTKTTQSGIRGGTVEWILHTTKMTRPWKRARESAPYYGGVTFYYIKNSINLIGTCFKINTYPMYMEVETVTLLLVTLSCHSIKMTIFATPWRWRPLAHRGAIITVVPNPKEIPHLEVLGHVAYAWFGLILAGGQVVQYESTHPRIRCLIKWWCHRPWQYGRKHSLLNVAIC